MPDDLSGDANETLEEPVDRPFADKLLLAIIEGYRPEGVSDAAWRAKREDRLADAKNALFGEPQPSGRRIVPDDRALRWMGEEHYRDLAKKTMIEIGNQHPSLRDFKVRSERELAKLAAAKFSMGAHEADSRLRSKFRVEKDYWIAIARHHDDVAETRAHLDLEAIMLVLDRNGIKTSLITE